MSDHHMIHDITYLHELMERSFREINRAYDALMKHDSETKYVMASNLLTIAHQTYTELNRFQHDKELMHTDINSFFTSFDNMFYEFMGVIAEKDTNTSWLYSRKTQLKDSWKYVGDFLITWIKNNSSSDNI